MTACNRCGGWGRVDDYRHHLDGICFACQGTGQKQPPTPSKLRQWRQRAKEQKLLRQLVAEGNNPTNWKDPL